MEMKENSVKEGDWNDWYLSTKIGKKWKWQNFKNRKNHLVTAGVSLCCLVMEWSNCLSLKEKLFVATSSGLTVSVVILHSWLECLLLCEFFFTLFQCSLSLSNGTVIMHWMFPEWSFLFSTNNFCSYTFLLSVLLSVILSSLLCCSTVMNITVVFSKTRVVWLLNNSVIVMTVRVFPMQWLCTTHKYARSRYLLSDKFMLLTTVGFLYVQATVLVLFSPETVVLCV